MDNNLENNEVNIDSTTPQRKISNERKITLINLMFRKSTNATFLKNRDGIKAFPLLTEEEKDFIDEVYEKIKELDIGEEVIGIANVKQLQDELYAKCQIPREVVEGVKQEEREEAKKFNKRREEDQRKWNERMAKEEKKYKKAEEKEAMSEPPKIEVIEGGRKEEIKGEVAYKKDLYLPGLLCGKSDDMPDQPFIKHISYTPERIENVSPQTSYQFEGRTYTIKKVGDLFYMSAPNLQESISEYEITISKGNISKTIRGFGEISFYKMSEASYSKAVLSNLLGQTNLTDKELHGYLGSLKQTKVKNEEGELEDSYELAHLKEEYTAVAIWEQIEKVKAERNAQKVAGGEDR